jgi:hypothetical protein
VWQRPRHEGRRSSQLYRSYPLGYMDLDRRGAELLFQVLNEREERSAIAIASNEAFSGWTKTFTDPRLCAAIVDRLTSPARSSRPALSAAGSPMPGQTMTVLINRQQVRRLPLSSECRCRGRNTRLQCGLE